MANITVTVIDRVTSLGIENGTIVLYDTVNNTQTTLLTNSSGIASFANIPIGSYRIYNTYISANATPPTVCGFPSGYTGTTYPRRADINITSVLQATTATFNFDKPVPWSTTNGGNAPNLGFTLNRFYNLANGAATVISPNITNNAMGYSVVDNMLYGASGRSDTTTTVTLNYPNTYSISGVTGDCDANAHLFFDVSEGTFTCIDVDPTRTTYLRPLNPYNNYSEITISPYTVSYSIAANKNIGSDWSYVPSVLGIVAATATSGVFWILSLTTPRAYNVPVTGPSVIPIGVTFADMKNFYIPTDTQILKYSMTTTGGAGSVLSTLITPAVGDGARAVTAPVFYAQAIPSKTTSKPYGVIGDTVTYTIRVSNTGNTTATSVYFQDTIPNGMSFIPNTVSVNGVLQPPGTTPSFVQIGTMPLNTIFTVAFNALITTNTLPIIQNQGNINTTAFDLATGLTLNTTFSSNIVTTTIVNASISSTKQVDKSGAGVGNTLTYTINFQNTGNAVISKCIVLDTPPNATTFVPNSIVVNGISKPGAVLYPTGYDIGTIPIGSTSTITFNVTISSMPNPNTITNSAYSTYTYILPGSTGTASTNTNTVSTTVFKADLSGITKIVNKAFATCGDILTYTIIIPNSGVLTAQNVIFKDTIPNDIYLVK